MEDEGNAHVTAAPPAFGGLRKIVWLRQMLQRWQSTTAIARRSNASASASGDVPDAAASREQQNEGTATAAAAADDDDRKPLLLPTPPECADRRLRVVMAEEQDPGSEPMTPDAPVDVPRGCCAVYVGAERRRFVVPTVYLGMPVFRWLLEKAEEEFGFDYHGGALTIPCETEAFKYILVVMDRHRKGLVVDGEGNLTEAGESSDNR